MRSLLTRLRGRVTLSAAACSLLSDAVGLERVICTDDVERDVLTYPEGPILAPYFRSDVMGGPGEVLATATGATPTGAQMAALDALLAQQAEVPCG